MQAFDNFHSDNKRVSHACGIDLFTYSPHTQQTLP